MAPPKQTPKETVPKVQHIAAKIATRGRSPATALKKTVATKKTIEKIPQKMKNTIVETRQRTRTVPKVSTPKPQEKKMVPLPGSVTKSARKPSWMHRPKPAHSGVPVPEKMKKLFLKEFKNTDESL